MKVTYYSVIFYCVIKAWYNTIHCAKTHNYFIHNVKRMVYIWALLTMKLKVK